MKRGVKPTDWSDLDSWWLAQPQQSLVRSSVSNQVLHSGQLTQYWITLDSWWRAYTDSGSKIRAASSKSSLVERSAYQWTDLDSWWDVYIGTGHEMAVEIADLLETSNEEWKQSASPFDRDPLDSAVTNNHGPLLPTTEEGWSDWLAKLLRSSPGLVVELLDVAVDDPPGSVIREARLSKKEGTFRRPDILACFSDRGVSIEVKLGDTNFAKTAETASLIERNYPSKEWTHALLLPKRNITRLRSVVEPSVNFHPDEELQIEWETPGPVVVIYWRDVTLALRELLQHGETVDDHWAANAYLFCAAVEQQLLNFQPQPTIDRMIQASDVVETAQPIRLARYLEEQLTYLRERQ